MAPAGYPSFDWLSEAGVNTIARMLGREIAREQFERWQSSTGESSAPEPWDREDQ